LTGENISRVLQEGEKALAYLPEQDEMRCETAVAMGGAYWALGQVIDSEQAFALARAAALKCSHLTMAVPSTCYVGMQQAKQGRLAVAQQTYQEALRLAVAPDGRETPVAGFPNIKLGDVLRERNELELAGQHLSRGIQQCIQLGQADVLVDGYICLARYQMTVGDRDGAQDSLRRADQVLEATKVDPFVQCWLEDCRLRFWMLEGNLPAVVRWVGQSGLKTAGPFSYHYDLHHTNLARALVFEGRQGPSPAALVEAIDLLARLSSAADQAGWVQEKIKILVLLSIAYQSSGRQIEALQAFTQAMVLAEPGGYVRTFVDEGEPMQLLIADCRLQIEKESHDQARKLIGYVDKLLAAFAPLVTRQSAINNQQSTMVDPLSPRELEVLTLIAQGLSNREISARLFLALSTVKGHSRIIFDKLHVQRRTEAVARARELSLL
ncbi:MAG: LuxR C-terminal-related transcriptional regulator, partial [Anaerolineaceae bacterium]|nr:LuxR C-terminal-related transcriptional regulator [Anaerolineaceae bacterium]